MENNNILSEMPDAFEEGFCFDEEEELLWQADKDPFDDIVFEADDEPNDNSESKSENNPTLPLLNNEDDEMVNISCDGSEIKMSRKEMLSYAKRGMRKNDDSLLDTLAEQRGLARDEFIKALEQDMEDRLTNEKIKQGIPAAAARRIASLEMNEKRYHSQQRLKAAREKHERFKALAKEYPNLKELPPQVINSIRAGRTPLEAYREYDVALMREELERTKGYSNKRTKSIGSMADTTASPPMDDFLIGWESV